MIRIVPSAAANFEWGPVNGRSIRVAASAARRHIIRNELKLSPD